MFLPIALTILISAAPSPTEEAMVLDTLQGAVLVSSAKQMLPVDRLPSALTIMGMPEIEARGIGGLKGFASVVPNLHIPDYGSAMTSSVYLRGMGSRMDNPVMGLYIDDIPIMNKNAYDFDFNDMADAVLLRGPQSTLYGRNSMCGVLALTTLSSRDFNGYRASVEYGNANTLNVKASAYWKSGFSFTAGYRHSDGFWYNNYDGRQADGYDSFNAGFKARKSLRTDLLFENILSISLLGQDGYAYRQYDEASGVLLPLSYNDPSGYRRLNVREGIKFKYMDSGFSLNSVTSLQFLSDEMTLDQDFTDVSLFTLRQAQNEGTITQELILKPEMPWRTSWWNWQTGFFGFFRYNGTSAPVRFKRDGIDDIILANANAGIQAGFPGAQLLIEENEFDISSDFGIMTGGAALYHESYFTAGKWQFTAGIRFDYEGARMDYDSRASLHYRFEAPGLDSGTGYRPYECVYKGYENNSYFEFMPKISALYDFGAVKAFVTASEGYKAGGFNVQIFSDILQNMMMNGIMDDLGVHFSTPSVSPGADNTVYKPEKCLNLEAGMRFEIPKRNYRLSGSVSAFHMACTDQQITVFPPGMNTGRMMSNVGRSRSTGVEADLAFGWKGLSFTAAYGWCDARFVEYDDGNNDWSGNRIPYSPEHTINSRLSYMWNIDRGVFRSISAYLDYSATGRIWWNESNTLSEPFRSFLGAGIRATFDKYEVWLRGENLTDTQYRTFYFKSVGRSFFQVGKPVRFTIGVSLEI